VRLWSESLYLTVLLGALWALTRARAVTVGRGLAPAIVAGLLLGLAVLSRGVAQYLGPLFALGLLWGRPRAGAPQLVAMVLAATLTVAPYSAWATKRWGSFTLSDRTLGQMMWLGNNDFPPMTFDSGNGSLSKRAFARARNAGRLPCGSKTDPLDRDLCQSAEGKAWIKANPAEFVRRIPLRLAQLCNPHSLLTRHLRWGAYKGMPQWMDELLVLGGALGSMLAMIGGAAGLTIRGKGAQGAVFALLLLYHCAAISALAGLTRYRVPLEPLLMVYCAALLADPAGARRQRRRCRPCSDHANDWR
jgi:4-amino-4-deoxy-L-arabinose transferase-like glycosyltransferase